MYRAGGPVAAGLPWSRHHIKPWTTALTAAAALAIALPFVLVGALVRPFGPADLSIGRVLIAIEALAIPLVLATAGAMLLRGRRVSLGPLLALALFPIATALATTLSPLYRGAHGPAHSYRAANVFLDTEITVLFGASASAAACVVLAVAMGGITGTVDRGRLDVLPRSPWAVVSAGSAWFLIAFAVRATNASAFGTGMFLGLSLVAPLAATVLAAFFAWCSGIFARGEDVKEPRAAFATVVVASLASGAAILLLDRAAAGAASYVTMRALNTDAVEPFSTLLAFSSARSLHDFAVAVDIAGCATVFGMALRSVWTAVPGGERRRDLLRSRSLYIAGSSALSIWLVVVIASLAGSASRSVSARAAEAAAVAPGDLELPSVRAEVKRTWFIPSESIALHADGRVGKLVAREAVSEYPVTLTNVYADRRAPYSLLADAVGNGRIPMHFHLISRREVPLAGPNGREALGDLGAFLPAPDHATPVTIRIGAFIAGSITAVLDDAPVVRLQWQGKERIVSLGGEEDAAARSAALVDLMGADDVKTPIRVLPRATDTIERVLAVVTALGGRNVELGVERPTSSGRGSGGSASSP